MNATPDRPSPEDIQAALDTLPRLRDDLVWIADAGDVVPGSELAWVHAILAEGSASSPEHLLLFRGRRYLGTATEQPQAYTKVIGTSVDTITVQYRWLIADEPSSAPAGVGTVRYQISDTIAALDPAPWPAREFYC